MSIDLLRRPTHGLHTWRGRLESSCTVSVFPSWNKKGDWHRSEAEPVPVPLRAEADAPEKRLVRPNLIASPFHDVIIWSGYTYPMLARVAQQENPPAG